MAIEYETKVLDIDSEAIRNKLLGLGAEEKPEQIMRRWVYDIDPSGNTWLRLRDNGNGIITMTYKSKNGTAVDGTEEIEVEVSDFDSTAEILSRSPFGDSFYQENKRTMYILDGIEFSIDSWPKIPIYLEIESDSLDKVNQGLDMLELRGKDVGNQSVKQTYAEYDIDLHSIKELKF